MNEVFSSEMVVTFDRFPCIQEIKVVQRECPYVFCFFFNCWINIFFIFFLLPFFFLLCVVYLMTWWRDGRGALCCYSFRLFFLSFPIPHFPSFFVFFFISTYLNRNSNNISYDGAPFLDWSSSRERFNSRCSSSHVYLLSLHQVGIVLA